MIDVHHLDRCCFVSLSIAVESDRILFNPTTETPQLANRLHFLPFLSTISLSFSLFRSINNVENAFELCKRWKKKCWMLFEMSNVQI